MPANTEKDQATLERAKTLQNTPWCDDYEKMISGVLYNCLAPELVQGRFRARRFMHTYNHFFPDDATPESLAADRESMLKAILGNVGPGVFIEPPFSIDYGCNISLGHSFYANFNTVILDCGIVSIGHRVMFGPNVSIFAATHETDVPSRRDGVEYAKPVSIGDDCWIGGNVSIMPGVSIANGCTIGAGSVVTKDVPAFSVAMGSPARVVSKVEPVPDMDAPSGGGGPVVGIPEP